MRLDLITLYMKVIQSFTSSLEKTMYDNPSFFEMYALPYEGVVKREIELGDITSEDTVLNLGCGALPFTAVHIVQLTGARVHAVDKDTNALKRAKKIVDYLGLSEDISFFEDDCLRELPTIFDKALVALQVEPKNRVLENLISEEEGSVIVRAPRDGFEETYGEMPDFEPTDEVEHNMLTFDRSLLFDLDCGES